MIFATVGTQLPFPRMLTCLRQLVEKLPIEVFAQTITEECTYSAAGMLTCVKKLSPQEFDAQFSRAELIVSHAGIGSIISAARARKPIALIPRRHEFGEHRNDHQMDTVRKFADRQGLYVAHDFADLLRIVNQPLQSYSLADQESNLINGIRRFIWGQDQQKC
jgi:UDP-N-acetylglucosamine transferase subunit ALG13